MGKKFIILLVAVFAIVAAIRALVISCQDPLLYSVQEICYNEDTQSYGIFIEYGMEEFEKAETTDFLDDEKYVVGKMKFFHEIGHYESLEVGDVVSFYFAPPYTFTLNGEYSMVIFKLLIFANCFLDIFSALLSLLSIIVLVIVLYLMIPRIYRKYVSCRVRKINTRSFNKAGGEVCNVFYITGLDDRCVGFDGVEDFDIDIKIDALLHNWRQIWKIIDLEYEKIVLPIGGEEVTALKDDQGNWYFFAGNIPVRKLIRTIKRKLWLRVMGCILLIAMCLFIILI